MANINIKDLSALNLTGVELFNDSESFMTELSEDTEQIAGIYGGHCEATSCQETVIVCLDKTNDAIVRFA